MIKEFIKLENQIELLSSTNTNTDMLYNTKLPLLALEIERLHNIKNAIIHESETNFEEYEE